VKAVLRRCLVESWRRLVPRYIIMRKMRQPVIRS
jgi:hypothetical protein